MKQTKPNTDDKLNILYPLLAAICITTLLFVSINYLQNNNATVSGAQNEIISVSHDLSVLDEAKYKEDYIYVDLSNMRLSTYDDGELIKTYNIVTKGKPGSYYETPSGNYEVQAKYGDKFSSLGEVYMPNSIQFQGNYFIHGIPYHSNGQKVSSTYSGGCIRLGDNDSKEVYDFANKGVKIIVVNNETNALMQSMDLGEELSAKLFYILISLDVSNQERFVIYSGQRIKALNLIPLAINGDEYAYDKIYDGIYDLDYYKERKLKSLGINDATFKSENERIVLYNYIKTSKSYLLQYL